MTRERLEEIFNDDNDKYSFCSEPHRKLKALNILAKYSKDVLCAAEHDELYSCDVDDVLDKITEDEAKDLVKYRCMINSEFDCFYFFV